MNQDSHPLCELTPVDTSSIEFKLRLATDPTTASNYLRKLADSGDRQIRETIAGNPNAPTELLLQLGADFPEQLLNNPIFPLLCLEELHQVDDIPLKTLCSLLKQPNVPEHFFELGVKTQNWEAIGSLGMNPKTPKAILERLVQTTSNSEWQQVAKLHVNWEGEISEGGEAIAREEMERIFTSYSSRIELQQCKQLYVNSRIGLESLPDCVIQQQEIAADPKTSRRILESLSCSEHFEIRLAVAAHPSTPSEVLTQLAQEPQDWINQAIAGNPNTPPAVLTQLATDSQQSVEVLQAIALHPDTPLPILQHLVSSKYPTVTQAAIENIYWEFHGHPKYQTLYQNYFASISPDLPSHLWQELEQMVVNPDPEIRSKLAAHPKTPPQILSKLAHDLDIEVRLALVNNPQIPRRILGEYICKEMGEPPTKRSDLHSSSLVGDILKFSTEDSIQIEIGRNPNTPKRLLRRLANHSDPRIRSIVEKNPHTPPKCVVNLTQDKSKQLLFLHDHTLKELEEYLRLISEFGLNRRLYTLSFNLARDSLLKFLVLASVHITRFPEDLPLVLKSCLNPKVPTILRLLALCYPEISATDLGNLPLASFWIERYCITQHPNTPTPTLEQLAQDGNRIVRAAAKARLQGHPGQNLHSWIMK
ncbi:hypothetical protein [Oscillatoria acuminata]|uniref:Leucine rich repeat protein n=1 Tax=Oscillatoria acuminata PCC 6304 TaxID=56110 RepID=K9TCP2_9CYAN|nr:hypothetical protein [Oscillatoria acuminata]AFY80667.1 Leucine rich repeat protein [Oscillatoria acuminata PCC 6304]